MDIVYLSKLLRVQTKRFPIRVLKKRGEEQNSLHGVVLVGVTSQRWPITSALQKTLTTNLGAYFNV